MKIRTDWIWGTQLGLEYQELIGKDNVSLVEQEYVRSIDLNRSEQAILATMSHGHRYDIRHAAQKGIQLKVFDSSNITEDIWVNFLKAHMITDSRKNRNPRCWEIMFEFIKREEAFLVGACYKNKWIAFAYILIYDSKGYYAMGNLDYDYSKLCPSPVVQWEAMRHMKNRGIKEYVLGTEYKDVAGTNKEENISFYKKGFGGKVVKSGIILRDL